MAEAYNKCMINAYSTYESVYIRLKAMGYDKGLVSVPKIKKLVKKFNKELKKELRYEQ
jgi:hypothetical protein